MKEKRIIPRKPTPKGKDMLCQVTQKKNVPRNQLAGQPKELSPKSAENNGLTLAMEDLTIIQGLLAMFLGYFMLLNNNDNIFFAIKGFFIYAMGTLFVLVGIIS